MRAGDVHKDHDRIRRFGLYRIFEHLALILLFVMLAATGLPQKFHTLGVSETLIFLLGGIDTMRAIHHTAGVLFTVLTVQHILVNCAGILFLQWQPSMLVTLKDAQDALQNIRYYTGLDDQKAACGRYTYKEKCLYWLVLIGGVQMIVTGLVLWFPAVVTKILPGQFVPASRIIHTSEAMMILVLLATWHIYDSVLSPDVFPLNRSIFIGYMDRNQMERLHPLDLQENVGGVPPAARAEDREDQA